MRNLVAIALLVGLQTCISAADRKFSVKIYRAESEPAKGLVEVKIAGTDKKVYIHPVADLTLEDIAAAKAITDQANQPAVEIGFTKDGAKKMAKLSSEHQGRPMAIAVEDKVVTAPILRSKISDVAVISGVLTKDEAERIARAIRDKK